MRDLALMGYARSGKDTAGAHLVAEYGYTRVSFADPVRESLLALDPIVSAEQDARLSEVVEWHGWDAAKTEFPEVRRLLQAHGTEAVRGVIGDDTWVRIALRKIAASWREEKRVVVTDCRFPNEAAKLRAWGFRLVWIHRPGVGPANDHVSDRSLSALDSDDIVLNSGSLADLRREVSILAGT